MSKRAPTALFHSSVCHGSVVTPINRVRATDVGAPGEAGSTIRSNPGTSGVSVGDPDAVASASVASAQVPARLATAINARSATVRPTVRTLTRACRSNRDLDALAFEPMGGTPMGGTPASVMTSGMPVLVEHRREGDDAGRRHEERHLEDEDRK